MIDLKQILAKHAAWLRGEECGERADLSGANLSGANLSGANLSGANGLLKAVDFLQKNFHKIEEGYLVFKRIGKASTYYPPPAKWVVREGAVIEEVPNPDRCTECGCGVNFGTLDYCNKNSTSADLWECLLRFEDLADTVVPYMTEKAGVLAGKYSQVLNETK